jgi:hypothetical protein
LSLPERCTAAVDCALGALRPGALRADPRLSVGEEPADLPEQNLRGRARRPQGIDPIKAFQHACRFIHMPKVVVESARAAREVSRIVAALKRNAAKLS